MSLNSVRRAIGLDALRGFAILAMFLSGLLPFYSNTLPNWMYHAQIPPPLHKFNPNLPGLTWVDLVFPFFIFSMGSAIPLALTKRIESGFSCVKIWIYAAERFLLLAGFAIFIQHVKPYALNPTPSVYTWLIALLGFILLFPVLYRFPKHFNKRYSVAIKIIGVILIVVLLSLLRYPNKTGFLFTRSDIIILVLANVSFFGTLIWYYTKDNILIRLGLLGFLLAIRLGHTELGFIKELWNFTPFPWLYTLYYLQYLFVLIPGTIIGDFLLNWMSKDEEKMVANFTNLKLKIICLLMFLVVIAVLIGLHSRQTLLTFSVISIWAIVVYYLVKNAKLHYEILIKKLYYWGLYFLLLGLFFEPYEGGIKKDHPTLSYYFVTVGLAIFFLIALTIIIDILKKESYFEIFVANGQNPMIAYAGISNLIPPILGLSGLAELLSLMVINPWLGFVKGVLITILLGIMVKYFTKYKIFLRT